MDGVDGKPYILVYGSDPVLLKTRQWVLVASGLEVVACSTALQMKQQLLGAPSIALLLLCHSLAPEACKRALTMAATLSPSTVRLLMNGNSAPGINTPPHATCDAEKGPAALVHTVWRLIAAPAKEAVSLHLVTRRR